MLWGQTAFLIVSHSPTLVKVQVPLRKVKLPCGLAVSKGGGLSPGWGKTKASGCSGLPSVPSGAGLSLSGHGRCRAGPTQSRPGRAALRSASSSPPRGRQVDTHMSRFPGADSERSSRRLPSNGFPKERFRIMVFTRIWRKEEEARPHGGDSRQHPPSCDSTSPIYLFLSPHSPPPLPASSQGLWLMAGL